MVGVVVLLFPMTAALVPTRFAPRRGTVVTMQNDGRTLRLAEQADLMQVARLQLDAFDPVEETPEAKPSMLASLFGGGGGARASREQRQERLAVEIKERVEKGSDIWVVEGEAGVSRAWVSTPPDQIASKMLSAVTPYFVRRPSAVLLRIPRTAATPGHRRPF